MIIYDIEVLTVNEQLISLGRGYLNHEDTNIPQSWDMELYDTDNDNFFNNILDKREKPIVKIGTEDGKSFIGQVLIRKLEIGPLGTTVLLTGTGPLNEV
ncbi:hypothetical protein MRBLBA21_003750 [Peribacillus frigoritolerans]|uniref:hypothetical protein n=1 Tax=Peribacillus frigoritolerans TaxID=450367 RepID=UPI00342F9C71